MFAALRRMRSPKPDASAITLADVLGCSSALRLCLLDAAGTVLPPVAAGLARLMQCENPAGLHLSVALAPLLAPDVLAHVNHRLGAILGANQPEARCLEDIEMKAAQTDGSQHTAHVRFDIEPLAMMKGTQIWLLRATDVTATVQTLHDLEELRSQLRTQGDILRGVLQMGAVRFAAFVHKADASMKSIAAVLKKPAREADAFRSKLEEILDEVDRVRREAAAFKLSAVETTARLFEDALQELKLRRTLSGSDFLPLALKLDCLYEQVALVRSLTLAGGPMYAPEAARAAARMTDNGTQIIEAPKFEAQPLHLEAVRSAQQSGPAGSLDSTLRALTDHVAQAEEKQVVLESHGLELVPPAYQSAIKNVAIQLIRNAVMHGIEKPAVRQAAGKPVHGTLRLSFAAEGPRYELFFEDDGYGLMPQEIRDVAVARGAISGAAAATLSDREAIKLIFKTRYTTLATSADDRTHGGGMSLVRRYVHEAGGRIALASTAGRDTRFKITLPAVPSADIRAA